MNSAAFGRDAVDFGAIGDTNFFDRQGIKDFNSGSPAYSIRQVVVANEKEDWDTAGGQPIYASGKLPLLSLARLTSLIGITTEENKVYFVFQGIVYDLVEGKQEVEKACG